MTAEDLKKSILQQAIQGKLVPQNPDDEPASALLERIRAEKARLVAEGRIKRDKNESVIYRNADGQYIESIGKTETDITDQIPFEIPDSWEWVRLENITYPVGNKNNQILSKEILKEGSIPVVSQGQNLIDGYCENIEKRIDDIPLVMFGDHTRNVKYIDFPFVIGADGTKFHKCIIVNSMSLFYWMIITADQLRDRGYARHYSLLKQCFIPLPPLAEQERIVAKIEELMPLVEEYGRAQSRLDELNSSLGDNLRKSVLQYAIQGKLVPQSPDEESASVLLDRIRAEKTRLVAEGKIKRDKNESLIYRNDDGQYIERIGKTETDITDQIPFEIPKSWEWVRLENVTYPVGNKNNQIQSKEILKEGSIPVVSQGQNLIDGYCENIEKRIDDIPLVMFGDHTRNVKYIDFPFVIGADGTKFHKCIIVNPMFLFYWMTITADQLRDRGYARHYSLLKQCFIPVPPLAEQKRIVERIDQILSLYK